MKFVAKVDDMGKESEIYLDDKSLEGHVQSFEVKCVVGRMTLVTLNLLLVEVDLDLGNVQVESKE